MEKTKVKKIEYTKEEIENYLTICYIPIMKRRAKALRELFLKAFKLGQRLHDYGEAPTDEEIENIVESKDLFNQNKIKSEIGIGAIRLSEALGVFSFENVFNEAKTTLSKVRISEELSFLKLGKACDSLGKYYFYKYPDITYDEVINFDLFEHRLIKKTSEALGYWTAKLEHKKRSKNQETKNQQKAIKEKYVTETFLKLINNPTEKKVLENLSQNKIAKRIQDISINDLQNVKTATGKPVLKRKIDSKGNIKFTGLETDTIIAIMRKQDKFTFNPFKKNISK